MGVLNVTPDSFSDGGQLMAGTVDLVRVRERAVAMIEAGAAILDVGGESTRPGAEAVPLAEELRRVLPVLEALADLKVVLSIDSSKAEVARAAVAAGCTLVNDVCGLRAPGMLEAVADSDAAVCIMHMLGEPRTMQRAPRYGDVHGEVRAFLSERWQSCRDVGIAADRIALDPGFGFGKTIAHNLELLRRLDSLRVGDSALLVGLSRKSMLGTLTGRAVGERLVASAVAAALAAERGADILRVHDVAATRDALALVSALRNQPAGEAGP